MNKIYLLSTKTDPYGFVKQIAAEKYNIDANTIEIERSDHGKPDFAGLTYFHFNISHSGELIALAVSESAVGVDVERLLTPDYRVSKRCCEDEQIYISDSPIRFFEIWTKKEAILKYQGTGISGGLKSFSVQNTALPIKTFRVKDYIISVCGEGEFQIVYK